MHNDATNFEREETVKSELLVLYNIIDWVDFGLVFAIIFYVGYAMQGTDFAYGFTNIFDTGSVSWSDFMFALPPSVIGLLLCVASLVVSASAIIVSRLIYKKGAHRSRIRLISRYIVWGIWIPIDLYFIYFYATGLLRG